MKNRILFSFAIITRQAYQEKRNLMQPIWTHVKKSRWAYANVWKFRAKWNWPQPLRVAWHCAKSECQTQTHADYNNSHQKKPADKSQQNTNEK